MNSYTLRIRSSFDPLNDGIDRQARENLKRVPLDKKLDSLATIATYSITAQQYFEAGEQSRNISLKRSEVDPPH